MWVLDLESEFRSDLGGVCELNQKRDGDPPSEVGSKFGESGVIKLWFLGMGMFCGLVIDENSALEPTVGDVSFWYGCKRC